MSCEVLGKGITSTQKPLTSDRFPQRLCLSPLSSRTTPKDSAFLRSGKGGSDCSICRTQPLLFSL